MAKICLATVTTKDFIPATLVMLHSFLKHNPWFGGDIVIIHADLDAEDQQIFQTIFSSSRFLQVSNTIKERLTPLLSRRRDLLPFKPRFFALETFRLQGYEKALFYDSDILFQGSIQNLLEVEANLICCGEGLHYVGGCRDPRSLADLHGDDCSQKDVLRNTFSSGFLLIDRFFLTDAHYRGLLNLLDPDRWAEIEVRMSDQAIFNLYFAGEQTLAGSEYNYLLRHRAQIYAKEGLGFAKAKVLHYNGPIKPWKAEQVLSASQRDPGLIQAMSLWHTAYAEALQALYLRRKFSNLEIGERAK